MIIALLLAQVGGKAATAFEKRTHACADGTKLEFLLMKPKDLETPHPLVLCLHGKGGNTDAAGALARESMREKYPAYVMAPKSGGARWAAVGGGDEALPHVFEAIEALQKELKIDPKRIYVTGQSMGGAGSFGAVAKKPELFAAATPICGGWDPAQAKSMAAVPFWIFHGDADPTVPVESSRKMVEALKAAGADPKYTEYPGVKHNSWDKAYAEDELWEWMFKQKRAD
jgi:predicted peptidase